MMAFAMRFDTDDDVSATVEYDFWTSFILVCIAKFSGKRAILYYDKYIYICVCLGSVSVF